ncbi:basement membrane-specific heparan sulfate proteoglycan core -like [Brachionus plicatilis]|uniref:Basement membrane-specific heparan sulfate proteoglycan core-like n=1 Tax=Brachionus plicatilis TaxID=10195 RepID=A0A3M7SE17_BRAPC|nr:basement membrane-specific heparan sulfate proteoglycan core -like [Brachionus plicatilis]
MKKWFFNGAMIQKDLSGSIKFDKLVQENQGLYECLVENENGQDKKGVQISFPIFATELIRSTTMFYVPKAFSEDTTVFDRDVDHPIGETTRSIAKAKHTVLIQVLSDPEVDHVENGKVILRCISDIEKASYKWLAVNETLAENVRVDNDILELKPFTKKNGGVYRCVASNSLLNQQASRRIKISIENGPKKSKDLSNMIQIDLVTNPLEMKIGNTINLKCTIDDLDAEVYWAKRGYKLSDRTVTSSNENSALITIKNFQKEDLGIYVCKARSIDSNGQASYYLMPSDFGLTPQKVKLLGPEVNLKCIQDQHICSQNLNFGQKIEIMCNISEFDTSYPELSIYEINWKKMDGSIIHPYSSVERMTNTQSKLTIEKLNEVHIGKYICYVRTSVSTVRKTFELMKNKLGQVLVTIDESSRNINLGIDELNGHLGHDYGFIKIKNYDFECSTDSIWPTEWYKKINDSRLVLKTNGPVLRIDGSNAQNYGEYVCISSNTLGTARIKLKIDQNKLDIEPLSIFRPFHEFILKSIENVDLQLRATVLKIQSKLLDLKKILTNFKCIFIKGKF